MLNSEMRVMTDPVKSTFKREGPLTVDHFIHVAKKYDLPLPEFDEKKTVVGCVAERNDILFLGQFDKKN